ncbi:unnamed protein product [Acanthoscelides obtectus]|uniref:C2H2-type domain-containing protein n=1 Tax=Acanthoscelides obtectus TaxID=200917 RepID=A0A9P0KIX4_ACAOB|nr:unnamed protein product [Acanthoscelides obtectus]CAK1665152.1 Zinc finger protein 26 [Acanthoscelides obtectus]
MVLDNHIIKEHPDCIASVSSRIFECEYCEYKTTMKNHLASHTLKHPESVCKFSICIHCNAKFKFKHRLNNHIIKEHPEFIASISARIHECTHCAYKTTFKTRFSEHMLKHPETADNYKFKICIHCNAKLKSTRILNDHIVRRHPEFIATVSAEIHECSHCSYKTTIKAQFSEHMLKHPETVDNFKFLVCIHCKATFKDKTGLDNHLIKKHPDFIASVSSKIHECKHCEYKTIFKTNLTRHVMKHPETVDNSKFLICNHCKATFKCKRGLNNHLINKHPDFIASVSCKIHECTHCAYKTIQKSVIDKHMSKHSKLVDNYKFKICIHCNAKLKSTRTLNDHIVRRHPEFIASVSAKIHECACCAYKTVIKANLVKHMKKKHGTYRKKSDMNDHIVEKHPEFVASLSDRIHECTHCAYKTTDEAQFSEHMLNHLETVDKSKSGICIHCKAKFQGKTRLDNHLIKKHPDFIASVSSKIHECKHCEYKTTIKTDLTRHMMKHPETVDPSKFLICVHCKATFKCKRGLNNHLINKHPDSIASVSSKIHECLNCAYKTIFKSSIAKHVLEHSESEGDSKFDTCIHCSAAFKSKHGLNNHIIKKHPEFISSVSSKIYECTHCSYKTTFKSLLARHMLQHPELVDNYKFSICIHCNAKFRSKVTLNDHLIKKHPDFIASVSSKIYECTYCAHKTTHKSNLDRHMSKHSELVDDDKFGVCIHCNAKLKSTRTLNDHIVKKHPEFIASVSAKIHECTCCAYKTVIKAELAKHMKTKHHT